VGQGPPYVLIFRVFSQRGGGPRPTLRADTGRMATLDVPAFHCAGRLRAGLARATV